MAKKIDNDAESEESKVHLDDLITGKLPERIITAISEMELTVEEVTQWEASRPPLRISLMDGKLSIDIRFRIPIKKMIAIGSAVGGFLLTVMQFISMTRIMNSSEMLPIEYPLRESLRIFGKRLAVFLVVVFLNLVLLGVLFLITGLRINATPEHMLTPEPFPIPTAIPPLPLPQPWPF